MDTLCRAVGTLTLVLSLLCTGIVARHRDGRTYCSTKSVIEKQPASVTCHFPEDVTVHKHSFNIMRYDFTGGSFLPELVLRCFWKPGKRAPDCAAADGFDFGGQISDTVTVSIKEAAQKHAGAYTCSYSAADPSEFNVCRLHVKRPHISCQASPEIYMGDSANVSCNFNTNLNHSKEGFYIRRVPSHRDSGAEWDILTCNWNDRSEGGIYCHTKQGCVLATTTIGTQVIVRIPNVDRNHTGQYFCDTVPHTRGVKIDPCYLRARDKQIPMTRTTGMEMENPSEQASSAKGFCLQDTLLHHGLAAIVAVYALKEVLR